VPSKLVTPIFFALTLFCASPSSGQDKTTKPQSARLRQAKVAYMKGIAALKEKKLGLAIASLKRAVDLAPDSADSHYALGVAWTRAGKILPNGWAEFHRAVFVSPSHSRASGHFKRLWNNFDGQGLFNIGVSEDEIIKTLGEADGDFESGFNRRLIYGFWGINFISGKVFSIVDMRAISQYKPALEVIRFELDKRDWQIGYRLINTSNTVSEWLVKPETAQSWTAMFSTGRVLNLSKKGLTPKQLMFNIKGRLLKAFPKATWKVIAEDKNSILYEWQIRDKKGKLSQHEIARLYAGKVDIYRIAYVEKVSQIKDVVRKAWIERLQKARLVTPTKPSKKKGQ
jgi:hypothetical protein